MCTDCGNDLERFNAHIRELGRWGQTGGSTDMSILAALVADRVPEPTEVLDLGCGDGKPGCTVLSALPDGSEYIGYEIDPYWVEHAERTIRQAVVQTKRVCVEHQCAADLSQVTDQEVGIVLCLFLIQDLRRVEAIRLFSEISRVLRAGGLLVLAVTVHPTESKDLGSYKPGFFEEDIRKSTYLWGKDDLEQEIRKVFEVVLLRTKQRPGSELVETYWLLRRN
jgi:ubiquinone/menaquinone biosynthesis C-methylase UbiE